MIGPDRLDRVSADALVPEQVVPYVRAVAGSRVRMFGACVAYEADGRIVLVGYPLHDPLDGEAMTEAVDLVLAYPGLRKITVIGPARPRQAPRDAASARDFHHILPLPPPPPGQKLRNLLRRARRDVFLDRGRCLGPEHLALVESYLSDRLLPEGTRRIFRRIAPYVDASPGSLAVSAWTPDRRLAAFSIGEYASLHTAFFLFSFRDPSLAPPGTADLVFSELLAAAVARGHVRMNLGLGVHEGIVSFKRKWGAEPALPCVETDWEIPSPNLLSRLRGTAGRRPETGKGETPSS